jgi:preprotein translocase subunit SecD
MFNRITAENVGKPLATVLTTTKVVNKIVNGKLTTTTKQINKVINIATIQSALGNSFVIQGLESMQYARNLALLLRSGAYSAPVNFVQERLVGPTLGKANIEKGKMSTFVGTLLVILFMAFYYRFFGLVADFALLFNLVFIVAILSIIGATLTLPGIAAIVLTLGMAVDANVLINERIREELRLGMTPQAAIHAGYDRAFMTIVDSNVTTLIVAIVLVTISSSSVKGFAINLIIGLLASMMTSMFFTRAIINLTYGRRTNLKHISVGIKVKPKK